VSSHHLFHLSKIVIEVLVEHRRVNSEDLKTFLTEASQNNIHSFIKIPEYWFGTYGFISNLLKLELRQSIDLLFDECSRLSLLCLERIPLLLNASPGHAVTTDKLLLFLQNQKIIIQSVANQ
jgi:hypothetical protein